jgi:hypothetical protein
MLDGACNAVEVIRDRLFGVGAFSFIENYAVPVIFSELQVGKLKFWVMELH